MTAAREVEVDEEAESSAKDEGRVRDTKAVDPLEDRVSLSFNRKTIESTRTDVEVRVGSAQHEDKDGSVDDVVEDLDTDQSGGDDEGGGGSPDLLAVGDEKRGVCSWYDETDDEYAADVEDQDPPEGPPDGDWDVLPGILSLADGDTDEFGSHVGEKGVDKSRPETEESGEALPVGNLFLQVLTHGAGGWVPVTETAGRKKGEPK